MSDTPANAGPPPLLRRLRPSRLRVRAGRDGRRIIRLHDELEGLLHVSESAFLYRIARGRGTIVEIGSFRGKSCVLMGLGSRVDAGPGASITCIDPHEPTHFGNFSEADHEAFLDNIRRHDLTKRVSHMRETSHDARKRWDGRLIDLLWIDGDHTHHGAKTDFQDWSPLLRTGGVIAAHDAFRKRFPGVMRAWKEVIEQSGSFAPTRRVRSIAWTERIR